MSKQETTFENSKVGDRVYSPLFKSENLGDKTNGVIKEIKEIPGRRLKNESGLG